jgi:Flp pilus assembly pilin Flp
VNFACDERGLTATEYGLLLALLGGAIIVVLRIAAPRLVQIFQDGAGNLQGNFS